MAQENPEDNERQREDCKRSQSAPQASLVITAPMPRRPAAGMARSMRRCHIQCGRLQTIEAMATLSALIRFPIAHAMKNIPCVRVVE
jgi:hypothetical protein